MRAEVVGGDVDLLPVKSLTYVPLLAQHFGEFQQQRTAAAGRIIHFVHLFFADERNTGRKLGNLLRREEFATRFSRIAGIHRHQELVGIAEGVDWVVGKVAELHVADFIENLHQRLVALLHRRSEFVAVHVDVGEQALSYPPRSPRPWPSSRSRGKKYCSTFRSGWDLPLPACAHCRKAATEDIESPLLHGYLTPEFGLSRPSTRHNRSRRFPHAVPPTDEGSDVLGNEAVEQHSQDVVLKSQPSTLPAGRWLSARSCGEFRALLFFCHMLFVYQFL